MVEARRDSSRSVVRDSLRARRRKRTRRVLLSYVAAALVIYGGAWHLAHHPRFQIDRIEVDGNVVSSDAAVAAAARDSLDSPTLSLLPMTNAYLARTGQIAAAVAGALPEAAHVSVSRQGETLEIEIEERDRYGYWCRAEDCFALDESGRIFAAEVMPSGATRFEGLVAAFDPVRERYAPEETWANLRLAIDALRARSYTPRLVRSVDGVDFRIGLDEGPTVILDATHSGAQALENLQIALDDEALVSLRGYEYADLRLPHKVFLKERVEAEEPADE